MIKLLSLLLFLVIIFFLNKNVDLFYTPSQIYFNDIKLKNNIKIGAYIKNNSIYFDNNLNVNFIITDYNKDLFVRYSGILPDLFADNKGIIVIGFLVNKKFIFAKEILSKHDENYISFNI